eukprot:tig00001302_g8090.t1
MFIDSDNFGNVYDNMRVNAGQFKTPVIIFVAPDPDAILAHRCITAMFSQDVVPFTSIPVASEAELIAQYNIQVKPYLMEKIHSILLINCGAQCNIPDRFDLDEEGAHHTVYVLDNHRPFMLENVHYKREPLLILVPVIHDEPATDEDTVPPLPTKNELEEQQYMVFEEDIDDSHEDEAESKRAKLNRQLEEEENDPELKRMRDNVRARRQYHKHTYYGPSSAMQALMMADSTSRRSSDFVWFGAVGLMGMMLMQRVDSALYTQQIETVADVLQNLTSSLVPESDGNAAFANFQDDKITFKQEFRFMLLNHWTLYESMLNSPFVAAKLATFKEAGRNNLNMLLAKAGIPLRDAKRHFSSWTSPLKDALDEGLEQYAEEFQLDDFKMPSFVRRVGMAGHVTASDIANALAAVVELGVHVERDPSKPDRLAALPAWQQRFWQAYDILNWRTGAYKKAIQQAIAVQAAVMSHGRALLEKKKIVHTGPFRYVVIDDIAEAHAQPIVLERLANFLVEALRELRKPLKPMLVCGLRADAYICVGVAAAPDSGSVEPNPFNYMYRTVAEASKAKIEDISFDMHVIKVPKSDFQNWIDKLHSSRSTLGKRPRAAAG